ncbi:MAG: PEP/pyruvate-binding domain-containing protein [Chloroflexota bacterium]
MTLEYTLPLADPGATLETVGGKGASLARLANAGLPVPGGFHITTEAYRRFVAENNLQPHILEAVRAASPSQPSTLETTSRLIADLFARAIVPDEIAQAVARAYAELPGDEPAVAVRSSATAEDLPDLSFAGQQDTYLNIRGANAVQAAVQRCWASLWTARAIGYRAQHGIEQDTVSLAVVVQLLVPAEVAGILFTANPIDGRRDQAMVTATWGLGEAIVGGTVTPDTLLVDKASGRVIERQTADKQLMTVRAEDGTEEQPVPEDLRRAPVLDDRQAAELARLGVQIEELYGLPMDIEWAWTTPPPLAGEGGFAILQARPITALPEAAPSPLLEWRLPDPKGRYARASAIELLPDPLSPLFATLGMPEWGKTMGGELGRLFGLESVIDNQELAAAGEHLFITINDYAYYDIGFITKWMSKWVSALPRMTRGLGSVLGSSEARWAGESRPRYAAVVAEWESRDPGGLPAGELLQGARALVVEAARHYLSVQAGILPAAYMSEALFTFLYERAVRRRGDPPALTFLLGFASTPIRAEQSLYDLAQWARSQGLLRDYLLRASSAEIAATSADPQSQVAEAGDAWPEFRSRLADHLARFGAAIYDLDFAKPTPADDPTPLLETVKFFLSDEAPNPYVRLARSEAAREGATQAALARLGGPRLRLFRRTLRLAQRFAPLREDALADAGLGWPVLRRLLGEVGRRLATAGVLASTDDVYWLRVEELQADAEALDGARPPADRHAVVSERRARWTQERRLTPPVALPPKEGMRFFGISWERFSPARTNQGPGGVIKGLGTSPGRVTGTARVIQGPEEFTQMRPGDILVARITTPAWTPLFALAGGVVTDVGGPLSHSSIVAREYGVPAVLGTGVATERIRSGQRITVNGDAGTVVLADGSGADADITAALGLAGKGKLGQRLALVAVALAALAIWRTWKSRSGKPK